MQDRKSCELEGKKRMEVEEKCAIDRIIYIICWSTKQNQNENFCHETPSKQAQPNIQLLFLNHSKTTSAFLSDFIHYQAIGSFIHHELKLARLTDLKPRQSSISHTQKIKKLSLVKRVGEMVSTWGNLMRKATVKYMIDPK